MQESSTTSPEKAEAGSPRASRLAPWLWAASPALILPLVEYLLVAPLPVRTAWLFMLPGLLFLPVLPAVVYVVAGPFLLIARRTRWEVLGRCGLCLVFVVASMAGLVWGASIRNHGFQQLAQRSGSLVAAIQKYERAKGVPPPALDALVPEFLDAVPGTGMAAYREYHYSVGGPDQNPWVLSVHTPHGGINFDQFLYYPRQNYSKRGHGGSLQRIGTWAYVHE